MQKPLSKRTVEKPKKGIILPELHSSKTVKKFAAKTKRVALKLAGKTMFFPLKNAFGTLQGVCALPDGRIFILRLGTVQGEARTLRLLELEPRFKIEKSPVGQVCAEILPGGLASILQAMTHQGMVPLSIAYGKTLHDAPIAHSSLEQEYRGKGLGAFMTRQADRHYRATETRQNPEKKELNILTFVPDIAKVLEKAGYKITALNSKGFAAQRSIEGERFDLNNLHVIPIIDARTRKERFFITTIKKD